MQVAESLTQLVVSAGNAAIGIATLKQQAATVGLGMLQHATGSDTDKKGGKSSGDTTQSGGDASSPAPAPARNTQPNAANISDPGALEVNQVLQLANALNHLVSGGPNGSPDWDKIRGDVCTIVHN